MSGRRGRRASSKKGARPKGADRGHDEGLPEALDPPGGTRPQPDAGPPSSSPIAPLAPMSLAPMLLDPEFADLVTEDLASDAAEALRLIRPPQRPPSGIITDGVGIDLASIRASPMTNSRPPGTPPLERPTAWNRSDKSAETEAKVAQERASSFEDDDEETLA